MYMRDITCVQGTFAWQTSAGAGEMKESGWRWCFSGDEGGRTSERNSNMPRNSERLCMECVRVLDCASKAYFSRTSDIATASSSLCNWLRHSVLSPLPSLLLRLARKRDASAYKMEDVFFGDACTQAREHATAEGMKKENIVCHVESRYLVARRGTNAASLPPPENICNFRRWGNIYHACTENTYPTD